MVLGLGLQSYMNGAYNPYMMGAQAMIGSPMMGGANSFLNFRNEDDMKSFYNSRIDDAQSGIYASGKGRNSERTYMLAQQLHGALKNKDSAAAGVILNAVKSDKSQLAGLELAYDQMAGSRLALRQDIREGMEGSKTLDYLRLGAVNDTFFNIKKSILGAFGLEPMSQREAIEILNGGAEVNTTVAANAIKEANLGVADRNTLSNVLDVSEGRMNEIMASYSQMGNIDSDIRKSHNFFIDGPKAPQRLSAQITGLLAS